MVFAKLVAPSSLAMPKSPTSTWSSNVQNNRDCQESRDGLPVDNQVEAGLTFHEEDVLAFDIAMQDVVVMQLLNGEDHLRGRGRGRGKRKFRGRGRVRVRVRVHGQLRDQGSTSWLKT
jgi:hypothetical protein